MRRAPVFAATVLALLPLIALAGLAHAEFQSAPTERGTLIVELLTDPFAPQPGEVAFDINFVNPATEETQVHIDYSVVVTKDGLTYGEVETNHTAEGRVKIPLTLPDAGSYRVAVTASGILFQPIEPETVEFLTQVGGFTSPHDPVPPLAPGESPPETVSGGCLVATAAFGTEMAPQVQRLREVRDDIVMNTDSGRAFMVWFNGIYYAFSPGIADLERQSPAFRGAVLLAIAPMVSTLGLLDGAPISGEAGMIGYGVGIILLNLGMYAGIPLAAVFGIKRVRARRA